MSKPDPKPPKRRKADVDEWTLLRRLKLGRCRVCNAGQGVWRIELHHLISRSLGGGDVPSNLVPLCSACHQRVENHSHVACGLLRNSLTAKETEHVLTEKGVDFLARRYPQSNAEAESAAESEELSA